MENKHGHLPLPFYEEDYKRKGGRYIPGTARTTEEKTDFYKVRI